MAWTTMHFGVGMAGGAVLFGAGCLIARGGWRWMGLAMTAGGIWANVPDVPRLFRVDFPGLGLASALGSMSLEKTLHRWGDLFFGHRALDTQPHDFALHGLILILFLYNAALLLALLAPGRRRRTVSAPTARSPAAGPAVRAPVAASGRGEVCRSTGG